MGARISRTWALVAIGLGCVAGGFLIDLDHPLQVILQGKSVFDWAIPHGRFLHIPILILAVILLVLSTTLMVRSMLSQPRPMHLN